MAVKITLTNVGYSISSTLDLYSNETGSWVFLETVSKVDLMAGYIFDPPVGATAYQVRDTGNCAVILELTCGEGPLPTTSTTTTTEAPQEILYWKFYGMCTDNWCYMTQDVKDTLEESLCPFGVGDRFYGEIEGNPEYLYIFTNTLIYSTTVPDCILTAVSRTTDDCNGSTGLPLPICGTTTTTSSSSSTTTTTTIP